MIEIIVMATAYTCAQCVILVDQGSYMSLPTKDPKFCFWNGPVITEYEMLLAAQGKITLPKTPPNGIEQRTVDGVVTFVVGKDIRDCRH